MAMILITHDLAVVAGYLRSDTSDVRGQIMVEGGSVDDIFATIRSIPYTLGPAWLPVPRIDRASDEALLAIRREPAGHEPALPSGCRLPRPLCLSAA